jgi:DNA-binding MarR family transcriptional regulator
MITMDLSMTSRRAAPARRIGREAGLPRRRDAEQFIEQFSAMKKRVTALAARAYATADLGTTQAQLLRHIGDHNPISQAELARATSCDPTLTSRTLQGLIERGLVRRERSDEDRREYLLELSAAGRRMHERIGALRTELAGQVVSALDDRDLDDFERIAHKIVAALESDGD